jgi:hypothetical protein
MLTKKIILIYILNKKYFKKILHIVNWGHSSNLKKLKQDFEVRISSRKCSKLGAHVKRESY